MKAVVVELKNNRAAVLSDNGCVVTVKNNGYEIGQVIQMTDSRIQLSKKIAVFAASAAAFVVLGTGAWAYATPYSYVSVDVNPSIEYTINRFDRVLSVKAVNDDGEEILQEIALEDLENQTIQNAILRTVEQITAAGYFSGTTEGGIVITTASENVDKAEELATDLQQVVEEEVTQAEEDVVVEAYSVGLERVEEARELGVTPGKLNLVEKLQASLADPDAVNIEEWLTKSVKEIMKATKDNRKVSVVSGAAITMDEKAIDKASKEEAKEEKRQERDEAKQQKDEEKSIKKSEAKQNDGNEEDPDEASDKKGNKASDDDKGKADKQSTKDSKKSVETQGNTVNKNDDISAKKDKSKSNSSDKAKITAIPETEKNDAANTAASKTNKKKKEVTSNSEDDSDTDQADASAKPYDADNTNSSQGNQSNEGSGNSDNSGKGGRTR